MELYCKEFVFFEWDDSLKGKKGFFADTINELKAKVKNGFELLECHFSNNPTGFHFANSSSNEVYQFFYYDPDYEVKKAFMDGKTIQYLYNDEWIDVAHSPLWGLDNTYRIKPEDECEGCMKYDYCTNKDGKRCKSYCTKVEYVPFDTVEGLIEAWDNKYPQNKNRPEGTMPLIWIKNKEKNRVYLITSFLFEKVFGYDVGTCDEDMKLTELFNNFTFLDGSIIGKRSK